MKTFNELFKLNIDELANYLVDANKEAKNTAEIVDLKYADNSDGLSAYEWCYVGCWNNAILTTKYKMLEYIQYLNEIHPTLKGLLIK
jgi:hypothetical protein